MSAATCCLFVYGTLRRSQGHPLAGFLADRADWVGLGHVAGRLYDLGSYPGLIEPRTEADWVTGDVYELRQAAETLALPDRYEGCGPEDDPPHLYERCQTMVHLAAGEPRTCWVYLYRGPVREEGRIVSGDYAGRAARG
jgi:gamma-glutamylcyclotransferase (GGCT)/AIG2-like uncharacterized protein YtfP